MLRTKRFRVALAAVAFLTAASSVHAGQIRYQALDLTDTTTGQDLWQYQYQISGFTFLIGTGFDIQFPIPDGYGLGDLQDPPPSPNADWDVISLQPDPSLPDPGRLNALALMDNASTADRFLIDFIWRGAGTPGSQPFEIFDAGFQTVEAGRTIAFAAAPEPATGLLVMAGLGVALGLRRRRPS